MVITDETEIRELLKADAFGCIERVQCGDRVWIRRDTRTARMGLRMIARLAAAHEARALARLTGLAGVPQLIGWRGGVLDRSYLDGSPMQQVQPRDAAYFRAAHHLLKALRHRGLAHNDLAKEPNWLVRGDGTPAIVDFQICWIARCRSAWFRLLAHEDLRHLLKHKRTYCPQALTPTEQRVLVRRSWLARAWLASGKRAYKFVARRWFGYWDDDGGALTARRVERPPL